MLSKRRNIRGTKSKHPESLKMLKTKEGQLNAVFACYGSAMQAGQLFEQSLSDFLSKYNELTNEDLSASELLEKNSILKNQTIGRLLHSFDEKVEIDNTDVHSLLVKARDQRNMLAHEYFLVRNEQFETYDGRMGLLQELVSVESRIRSATELVNGMRVAVEQTLEGESYNSSNSETLFTITLNVPS